MRPKTPWKRIIQLVAATIVATSATRRPASRPTSAAMTGTEATAQTTDTSRRLVSPGETRLARWAIRK